MQKKLTITSFGIKTSYENYIIYYTANTGNDTYNTGNDT